MPDPKTIFQSLRDWLKEDTLRRAGEDAHPYERGFEDGWDAAREAVQRLAGKKAENAAKASRRAS